MIFFGHRNYNKQDSVFRSDICQGCGRLAQLHSYTSTAAVHVYWIPVIPTGKKRIIDQCPHCDAGREMSLRQWKKLRNEEVLPSIDAVRMNPGDREEAINALDLTSAFGTPEEFTEVVQLVHPHFGNDSEIAAKMGWGMNRFQHPEEAQRLLNHSLTLNDDADVRQLMEFHRDAPKAPVPPKPNKVAQMFPFLIVPGIILFFVASFLVAGFTGKPSYVYLVNGLPDSYSVLVNSEQVTVGGDREQKLKVDYGLVTVGPIPGADYPFEFKTITQDLSAEFSERVSGGKTVVFNPDKTALIAWEEIVYFPDDIKVATEEMMEAGDYTLHAGQAVYDFPKVNYPFQDPPENVEMSGRRLVKTHLELYGDLSPQERVTALLDEQEAEAAVELVRAQLTADPSREAGILLPFLSMVGDSESALEFVEERLEARPVLVEWHRHYQVLKPMLAPDADLLAEYKARTEKEPENADLLYLYARLLPDGPEQQEVFAESTKLSPPSAYGFHALAYDAWVHGDFEAALSQQKKALELKPESVTFLERETEYLKAASKNDELLREVKLAFDEAPADIGNAEALVSVLGRLGQKSEANAVIQKTLRLAGGGFQLPPEMRKTYETYLKASYALSSHEKGEFVKLAKSMGRPWWNFSAAMAENDVESAARYLNDLQNEQIDVSDSDLLLVYAASCRGGKEAIAKQQLDAFLAQYAESESEVASWFVEGAEAPSLDELIETNLDSDTRCAVAVALAERHAESASVAEYLRYAAMMNYQSVGYPYFVVNHLAGD